MPCSDTRDNQFDKLNEYFYILRKEFTSSIPREVITAFNDAYHSYDWQERYNTARVLCTAIRLIGYERIKQFLIKNDDKISYEFLAWIADHREWDKKNGREW